MGGPYLFIKFLHVVTRTRLVSELNPQMEFIVKRRISIINVSYQATVRSWVFCEDFVESINWMSSVVAKKDGFCFSG